MESSSGCLQPFSAARPTLADVAGWEARLTRSLQLPAGRSPTLAEWRTFLQRGDGSTPRLPDDASTPGRPRDDRPIPWRWLFRRLSRRYGWTPRQILALTPAQAVAYLSPEQEASTRRLLPADLARAISSRARSNRVCAHRGGTGEESCRVSL